MKAKFGLVLIGVMLSIGSGVAFAENPPKRAQDDFEIGRKKPKPAEPPRTQDDINVQDGRGKMHGTGVDAAGHVTCPTCAARALAAEKAQREAEQRMAPGEGAKPAAGSASSDTAHQNQ